MMKTQRSLYAILFTALMILPLSLQAQDRKYNSPYEISWGTDGPWIGAALAASAGGFLIIQGKEGSTPEEIMNLNPEDVFFIDRWSAGYNNENLSSISDIPFAASFAIPLAFLLADRESDNWAQIGFLYVESLATTAALFTMSAGLTNRLRPRAYSEDVPIEIRTKSTNTRSFYSGHAAAAATATFFAAKVYSDFYPDAKNKWMIWAGAAAIPATVGALRLGAGQHFLTDVLLGYSLGALAGYYIPELHKKKNADISFFPALSPEYQGVYLSYRF